MESKEDGCFAAEILRPVDRCLKENEQLQAGYVEQGWLFKEI